MLYTTDGIVLRTLDSGDHDRLLTILTPDGGRISVMAKGARSMNNKLMPLSQQYVYGNFEIYRRGEFQWLRGGSVNEAFYGLRTDIEKLALASYFSEIACEVTDEGESAEEFSRILLNSLFAISTDFCPREIIKAVFELRTAAISGYMPDIARCRKCNDPDCDTYYLDVMNGNIICEQCLKNSQAEPAAPRLDSSEEYREERKILTVLPGNALAAMRYSLSAPISRMFSFTVKDENDLRLFSKAAETYLINQLERTFDSLEFYKTFEKAL